MERVVAGGPGRGEWHQGLLLLAANPWDAVKMQDQHMAEHLSRHVPVLYVDPPLSHLTPRNRPELADSLARPRLRRLAPGLARLTPLVLPRPERRGTTAVNHLITRQWVSGAVRRLGMSVRAVVAARPLGLPLNRCGPGLKVFWAQDDLAGGAGLLGLSERRLRRGERRLADQADLIIAGTPGVANAWRERGYDPVLVPYGCDADRFAAADEVPWPDDVDLPRPIAGFVGHLADRIDIRLLEAVAARGHSLLLVGPRHPTFNLAILDGLLARPNVRWIGPRRFEQLPSYLQAIDVGLVPYADSAFNRGSFPLKTLEYLAAGRAAIATDLPAVRWLGTDLVEVASEPEEFAKRVADALARPRTPALVWQRRAFAVAHRWAARAEDFLAAVDAAVGTKVGAAAGPAR